MHCIVFKGLLMMGLSKTEVNLKRLLVAAPQQQNQAKLIHYVSTLREQLQQLADERTPQGFPRVSKVKVHDYSEKLEAVAAKLAPPVSNIQESHESIPDESPTSTEGSPSHPFGLRRRLSLKSKNRAFDHVESDQSIPVKLDYAAQGHINKHRKLQEDLTDEMVVLAQQLKDSSLLMSQSLKSTDKILDSAEREVEHSLASTGHANTLAMEVNSRSFKTTCLTWLLVFVMTWIFIMVVLLIRHIMHLLQ